MNRRKKKRLLCNAKMVAACGAIAYLATGIAFAGEERQTGIVDNYAVCKHQTEEVPVETDGNDIVPLQSTEYQSKNKYNLNSAESYLLAKIAMAEAEGEDTEGKALVMLVVLNRTLSDGFPDSILEVIYQGNQFSPVSNGRFDAVEPNQDCWDALDLVEGGWDESHGAMYFESESQSKWHRDHLEYLFQHGNHYFYKEIAE